jgi:NAD(P)-dependent dehydrogenase (short-subunit alcohol dehydrogenase family)
MIDLNGKNALITGSSRGIGQQIALGLAQLGCNIIVHGRKKESCMTTLDMLSHYPVKTFVVFGELSDENLVDQLVEQVKSLKIPIDILYNNAAHMTNFHADYYAHSWKEWMDTFKVNVFALYDLCGAFIPGMVERGFGRVINLSSGIQGQPELAPYGATKWAVNKITDDLAAKLNGTGVRVNAIDPGWIKTDMGGENAEHPVEAVLPGILAPSLVEDDGPNGEFFSAIKHKLDPDLLKK